MSASWPFALGVIVVGGLAGVVIAGRPEPIDPFVLEPSLTAAESPSTSTSETVVPTTGVPTTVAETIPLSASTSVAPSIAPTITDVLTATPDPGPFPRDLVQLVIADGDERFQLASTTADRIRALGYVVEVGDTAYRVEETVLFYRPGFQREATIAATDIGVPNAVILELSTDESQPITSSDASGDIIVVLGPDAPG